MTRQSLPRLALIASAKPANMALVMDVPHGSGYAIQLLTFKDLHQSAGFEQPVQSKPKRMKAKEPETIYRHSAPRPGQSLVEPEKDDLGIDDLFTD